ncbi:MAG: DUF1588 domain-containing protein, partial [Methylacidiphilales bacterium]|nr:DUF1588 domain-containing protein [Candidatus Methylacidiphilales bacterium]
EAELFFADVLREDRSVLSFIDSDRTFLNERLATHYGVRGIKGEQLRMIQLPADSPRGGVLTMAATLTVTSEATRTSPVRRGDYVLSQMMGTAPPPPPRSAILRLRAPSVRASRRRPHAPRRCCRPPACR